MAARDDTVPKIMKQGKVAPWLYLAPALIVMTVFIVYPGLNTLRLSFMNKDSTQWATAACVTGQPCWGIFENYRYALTSEIMRTAFLNNLKWIVLMVSGTVSLGLLIAVLADRVRYEAMAKAIIFMPMAISFVGAGIIWTFVYNYGTGQRPDRLAQCHRRGAGRPAGLVALGAADQHDCAHRRRRVDVDGLLHDDAVCLAQGRAGRDAGSRARGRRERMARILAASSCRPSCRPSPSSSPRWSSTCSKSSTSCT